MRGHKRKYFPDAYEHIFQHALGYRVIFYSWEDRLVFFTIFSVMAWKYGIVVLALALMFNHFHALIKPVSAKVMSLFIGTVTATYALAFNRDSGRKGPLFEKAYGNATKSTEKAIRTCIAYNYNNSVEKKLFAKAEEDRWNFLAYIGNDFPFSEPILMEKASRKLRSSLKIVDAFLSDHHYLNYAMVRRLFHGLSHREKEQLTDYIISRYLPIDKEELLSFYKGFEPMVLAINSNTGSEYDIKEEYNKDSDDIYRQMLRLIEHSSYSANPHSILAAPLSARIEIASVLKKRTGAKDYQIFRILHLNGWQPTG